MERTCIVTGETLPKEGLMRFVASPDGLLTPDIKEKLPGRGCWVTATAAAISQACEKGLFARGLKTKVRVPESLIATITGQLEAELLHWLSLAKKAGALLAGFDKVEEALRKEQVALLLCAADAGPEREKLSRLARDVPYLRLPGREKLGQAIGRQQAVHLAVTRRDFAEKIGGTARRLAGFVKTDSL